MTRLSNEIVVPIVSELGLYDRELIKKTGKNLRQIAAVSVGARQKLKWPNRFLLYQRP